MARVQWFVSCGPRDNEYLAAFLAMHSIGDENRCVGIRCADGVVRDLWDVPGTLITKVRDAKRTHRGEPLFRFSFWKRDNEHQPPRRADFLEKGTESKEVRRVKRLLAEKR